MPHDAPPAISFAIPYYRGQAYLAEAIESVRAQTREDWELLVVDDCGPDPAQELVASYGDARITYHRNERNLGLAGNWNECVRLARAPWVTLLHGDDRLLPEYAERVLAATRTTPDAAAVFTDARIIGPTGEPTTTMADLAKRFVRRPAEDHDLAGDEHLAPLLRGNYILCPTLCLHRPVVGDAPFDARWGFVPDWDFTCRQLLAGHTLRAVRTPLLEYRRHGGQQTSALTVDSSRFVEETAFLEEMAREARALGWTRSERAARRRVSVRGHLAVTALLDLAKLRAGAAKQKVRILRDDLRLDHRRRASDPDLQE